MNRCPLTQYTMSTIVPTELTELLQADGMSSARRAWERFIQKHNRLLLEATRSLDGDYDSSMDRYAFVLEKLRDNDFRRLRAYQADGRARFTTWLVVVAKRLCIDHHRSRYGRKAGGESTSDGDGRRHDLRRRLVDLTGPGDVDELEDPNTPDVEARLAREERVEALDEALDALTDRERLLLALRYEDGATAREIHEIMGLPSPKHVYRRIDKLLGELREALEKRGIRGR